MDRVLRVVLLLAIWLFSNITVAASAEDASNRFSIIFGWKTGGSHDLLSRQATAYRQWKDTRSLAFSFGALLGNTLIVSHDTADQFLKAARETGLDYIIPAAPEFMFGVEALKRFADNDDYPRFLSANIVDEKTRRPVFEPYAMWYVSGMRICVIAMSDTSIIRESKDANVEGIDIVSHDEALRGISVGLARENADLVIVAGRLDRDDIAKMARKHPYVDMYLTNNQSGGFADAKGTTTTAALSGKPLYIGPEGGNQLGIFSVKDRDGLESREFTTVALGEAYPPEKELLAALTRTLDEYKRQETEEQAIIKTGSAVTKVLKDLFQVDTVLIERQSLFYFPLADSLTIFNVRTIIRPYTKLAVFDLKGSDLKSILEDSKSRIDPDYRLIIAGMTADGKIDSIPIGDDTAYTVLSTTHLRAGGNGYPQFRNGVNEQRTDINALMAVERYLVDKDERIQRAVKKKNWTLALNLNVSSNFQRTDVNREKSDYGASVPNPFKGLKDNFFGFFRLSSEQNQFTWLKRNHYFETRLNTSYRRTGTRPPNGEISYSETEDRLNLQTKYEYRTPVIYASFYPYIRLNVDSQLYSGGGKHPLRGDVSSGLSKKIPSLWMTASLGLNGGRDYITNRNTAGTDCQIDVSRTFAPVSILSRQTTFSSTTKMYWYPSQVGRFQFRHENLNKLSLQVWKKLGIDFNFNSYTYRDNTKRKLAVGYIYEFMLTYGTQWKR
ncbi:MAG: bifunctional UDP-sugar hydrolase/5'-nucleotidase [Candidatus Latescibacterota bacterium]